MRLPWFSWEKTLRRLGLRLTAKSRRPEYKSLHPQLERLEPRELLTVYMPGMEPVYGTLPSATEPATSLVAGSATAGSDSAGTVSTASVSTGSDWSSTNASLSSPTNIYATVAPTDPLPPSTEVLPETTADFDADVFWPASFTIEPTLTGTVSTSGPSGLILVEIDEDGDFVGDGLAIADEQGVFEYTPQYFAEGSVPLNIRAVSWNESSGDFVTGNWQSLTLPVTWTVVYTNPTAEPDTDQSDDYPDSTDSDGLAPTTDTSAPAVQAGATTSPNTPASAPLTSAPPAADDGDHKIDDEMLNQSGPTNVRVYQQSPRETDTSSPGDDQPTTDSDNSARTAKPAAETLADKRSQIKEKLKNYLKGLTPEQQQEFLKGLKQGFTDGFNDYIKAIKWAGTEIKNAWVLGREAFFLGWYLSKGETGAARERVFQALGDADVQQAAQVMAARVKWLRDSYPTQEKLDAFTAELQRKFDLAMATLNQLATKLADSKALNGNYDDLEKDFDSLLEALPEEYLDLLKGVLDQGPELAGYITGALLYEAFEAAVVAGVTVGTASAASAAKTNAKIMALFAKIQKFGKAAGFKHWDEIASVGEAVLKHGDDANGANKAANAGDAAKDLNHGAKGAKEPGALCFPAGTLVGTKDGLRPIETVAAGDRVWAIDLRTREWQLSGVAKTFVQDYDHVAVGITVDGETIVSTFRHPYWVLSGDQLGDRPRLPHHLEGQLPEEGTLPGRWVDAGDMRVGDVVLLRDGRQVPVSHVDMEPSRMKVYNFNVEALHCYAVGERQVLVHNTNGDELHHSDPEFMGGDPKQELTSMPKDGHRGKGESLHNDLNGFLKEKTDSAGNHMRPQRGNPGTRIRENFPRSERLDALAEFYKRNRDKYSDAARDFFRQHPELE